MWKPDSHETIICTETGRKREMRMGQKSEEKIERYTLRSCSDNRVRSQKKDVGTKMMHHIDNLEKRNNVLVEALYERYASTILTYLRQQNITKEDAEDLLVEVFLA